MGYLTLLVIDFYDGDKIVRKSSPNITVTDLLITNKIDIADQEYAYLDVIERNSKKMCGERPFVLHNL